MPTYDFVNIGSGDVLEKKTLDQIPALLPSAKGGRNCQWFTRVDNPDLFDALTQTRAVSGASLDQNARTRTITYSVTDLSLPTAKANASARAKTVCETKRASFLTAGNGKALEYREKAAEVTRWATTAAENKTAANFPLLNATAVGRGLADLTAAHDLISATLTLWRSLGAAICQAEDTATTAIFAANNCAAVRTAMATLATTLAGIGADPC
ncbi:MAG: hypothetical protein FJ271_22815 [Planctomycetes bacterium]|nr:hypothetical protein [Planctomycetota bacterium]